jgi:hypothetical protein
VRVLEALAVLECRSSSAAQWWREQTPYLIQPGKLFLFAVESCRLYDADTAAAIEPADAPVIVPSLDRMPMGEPAHPIRWDSRIYALPRPI